MAEYMGAIAIGSTILGSATSASGQMQAGKAAQAAGIADQQALNYRAAAETQQAGQVRAQSTHQAEITGLNTDYVLSSLRARAAASGAGATDPTVENLAGQVRGRGTYEALSQLATGEERARGLDTQSALDIYQGEQAAQAGNLRRKAANIGALGSLFQGAGSAAGLYAKYGR